MTADQAAQMIAYQDKIILFLDSVFPSALVLAFADFAPLMVPVIFGAMGFASGIAAARLTGGLAAGTAATAPWPGRASVRASSPTSSSARAPAPSPGCAWAS